MSDQNVLADRALIPSEDILGSMGWADLLNLRRRLKTREGQNLVAPYEHRAYMRENTEGGGQAAVNAMLTLGYTPFKMATNWYNQKRDPMLSDPSVNELRQGLMGVYEGLKR